MPYAVLGGLQTSGIDLNYEKALEYFDDALARDSRNTTAYLWRMIAYLDLGYFDRADLDGERCLEIDSAYDICRSFLALSALYAGDFERALEFHRETLRRGFFGNAFAFMFMYAARGEEDKVLIASAARNEAFGVNAATPYEYRAYVDPAFDYEAEKVGLNLAYRPAGKEYAVWGPPSADYLFLYRKYDEIAGYGVQY